MRDALVLANKFINDKAVGFSDSELVLLGKIVINLHAELVKAREVFNYLSIAKYTSDGYQAFTREAVESIDLVLGEGIAKRMLDSEAKAYILSQAEGK